MTGQMNGPAGVVRCSIDSNRSFRDTTKKKKVLSLGNLKAPFKFMGSKTYCKGCKKKCSGEVNRIIRRKRRDELN